MFRRSLPLLLLLSACGGSKPAAEEPASATASSTPSAPAAPQKKHTCAEAQANVAVFTQRVSRTVAITVGTRCAQDGWAPEVINCFAATQDGPQLALCTALLTPEQQRAFETQGVPDAVDPNAVPDPACAVFTDKEPPHPLPWTPAPAAPPAKTDAHSRTPLPALGLPRGGAGKPVSPTPLPPPGPTAAPAPAPQPTRPSLPGLPAPVAAPAPASPSSTEQLRIIPPKQLEQLRAAGETQLAPDDAEQRLLARCRIARATASFKLCIDAAGEPIWIETLRSSRLSRYDGRLVAAIAGWRYRPYLHDGKPTAVCSAVTFVFSNQAPAQAPPAPSSTP